MSDRRHFLALLGPALASGWTAPRAWSAQASTSSTPRADVLVLGAGLAGLAAARELQRQGYDVVVLEARDRIGGRIQTSHQWEDLPVELGATWIHGVTGNPLTKLADEVGCRRLATSYNKAITYDTNGAELSDSRETQLDRLRARLFQAIRRAQTQDRDESVRQAVASVMSQLDESSDSFHLANFVLSSELEQEYAGSADSLSAHWYDSAEEFDGDDVLFPQGMGALPEHLSRGLRIELGHVVQRIEWEDSPARVVTQQAEFLADQVLVTLPLGVLKAQTVHFEPPLPTEKLLAIQKLGMGVLNKCYLRFDQPFWPKDVDWLEYIPTRHGEWTEWVSLLRTTGKPVLLGFCAAEYGRKIEAWPDQEMVTSAWQTLRTMFGDRIPEPTGQQVTRWASDPFSRGSYSYHAVGSNPKMRKQLAAPLAQTLFFAGEATQEEYYGTAHGAYLSGVRAAREILRS